MSTFVLSPSKEESANFTMENWANLQDEALEILDSVGLTPNGFSNEIKTNFTNSMNVGGLHSDSKSGTLHLHIDCCRVDMEGKTNDVHDIHLRTMKAAEIINMRHGWEQPQEIRNMRKMELAEDCEHTLKDMQQFNIDRYFNLLRMKGYEVKPRTTSSGNLSAIQLERMLPCSRLLRLAESTWYQRLKTHGRNCTHNLHRSRHSLFLYPLLLRLAQFVLSLRLQRHHNQRFKLNLHKRHSQSTLAMESKKYGFRTLSKISLLMRFRFQRTMI